ncbi:proton-conducting transporter membrane subunit [Betaproteobacteria bacterium]|nr:proton-conducting transporter membrane subunit [Betaproteobacteria bacterium]
MEPNYFFHLAENSIAFQTFSIVIAVPIICAILTSLLHRFIFAKEFFSIFSSLIVLYFNFSLVLFFSEGNSFNVELIEVFPNVGLSFHMEPIGLVFSSLASLLWFVNSIYSIGYLRGNSERNQTRFYAYVSLSIFAVMGIAFASNLFTFFLFYELLTFLTYPLVTHNGSNNAKQGGKIYLGLLLFTSICFLLLAICITYSFADTLDFTKGGILPTELSNTEITILLLIFCFGIGKAALFPFHGWLPAAMVAPTPVSALLHAVAVVKAGVFGIIKIIVYIFGINYLQEITAISILTILAGFTIIFASYKAMKSTNLKQRLAYSTVSQLSYITMAASLATPLAIAAAIFHLLSHAFGKITLFFAAGSIYTALHKTEIREMRGMFYQMPITMICFALGAFSMIGLPPTVGLLSKWFIITGAVDVQDFFVLGILILSTVLNASYFLPIIYDAFFKKPLGYELHVEKKDSNEFYHYRYLGNSEAPLFILFAIMTTATGILVVTFLAEHISYFLNYFGG